MIFFGWCKTLKGENSIVFGSQERIIKADKKIGSLAWKGSEIWIFGA
jgi:hypothetical protein